LISAPIITSCLKKLGESMTGVIEKRVFNKISRKFLNKDFFEKKLQDLSVSDFQKLIQDEFKKEGVDITFALSTVLSDTKEYLDEIKNDLAGLWKATDSNLAALMEIDPDPLFKKNLTLLRLELSEYFASLQEDKRALKNYLGSLWFELSSISLVAIYHQVETRNVLEQRLNEIFDILALICDRLDIQVNVTRKPLLAHEGPGIELLDKKSKRMFDQAINELNSVIRTSTPYLLQDIRKKMTSRDVGTLLRASEHLYNSNDYQGALEMATRLIQLYPLDRKARLLRAKSLKALFRLTSSAEEFKMLLEDREYGEIARKSLIDIYIKQGKIDEALALMIRGNTRQSDIDFMRGYVTLSAGWYRESVSIYTDLLESRASNRLFDIHTNLGVAYTRLSNYKKAAIHFKKALKLARGYEEISEAHFNLGYTYHELKYKREARRHFREAVQANPSNTRALLNLGFCYREINDHRQINRLFNRISEYNPIAFKMWQKAVRSVEYPGKIDSSVKTHVQAAVINS